MYPRAFFLYAEVRLVIVKSELAPLVMR